MYSRDAAIASGENRLRSKPGPSCQNRKHVFPGRSNTVSFGNSRDPSPVKISLICFENGCLIRARYRLIDGSAAVGYTSKCTCSGMKTNPTNSIGVSSPAASIHRANFLPPEVVREQWHSSIARKRQFVQMPDLVKMPHGLPMGHSPLLPAQQKNVNPPKATGKASGTQFSPFRQRHPPPRA